MLRYMHLCIVSLSSFLLHIDYRQLVQLKQPKHGIFNKFVNFSKIHSSILAKNISFPSLFSKLPLFLHRFRNSFPIFSIVIISMFILFFIHSLFSKYNILFFLQTKYQYMEKGVYLRRLNCSNISSIVICVSGCRYHGAISHIGFKTNSRFAISIWGICNSSLSITSLS